MILLGIILTLLFGPVGFFLWLIIAIGSMANNSKKK